MRINVLPLALQLLAAEDAVNNLQPGDVKPQPVIHITDHDRHITIAVTVSRDAPNAEGTTHLPGSKG